MRYIIAAIVTVFLVACVESTDSTEIVDCGTDAGPASRPAFELPCDCPAHDFPCPAVETCGENMTCDLGVCRRQCETNADCPEEGAECAAHSPRVCMYACHTDADCTVPGLGLCVQGNCWP